MLPTLGRSVSEPNSQALQTAPEQAAGSTADAKTPWVVRLAINGSFALNVALLSVKLLAATVSGSMSVVASAADVYRRTSNRIGFRLPCVAHMPK